MNTRKIAKITYLIHWEEVVECQGCRVEISDFDFDLIRLGLGVETFRNKSFISFYSFIVFISFYKLFISFYNYFNIHIFIVMKRVNC